MKRPSLKLRSTRSTSRRALARREIDRDVVSTKIVIGQPAFAAPVSEPGFEQSAPKPSAPAHPSLFNRFQVEAVDIEVVRLPKRLLRKHSTRQMSKLTASIKKFDILVPPLVTDDYEAITGVARISAAKQIGLTTIPVIRISHLTPEEVRAFRLADNRISELGEWDEEQLAIELKELFEFNLDFNIELTGFDSAEVDLLLDSLEHVPALDPADQQLPPPDDPVSRQGDTWLLGRHRLHCGDATDAAAYAAAMAEERARLIFHDPPYNVPVNGHVSGLGKNKHREFAMASGEMSEEQFIAFLTIVLRLSIAHLIDGGIAYTCMDWRHLYELGIAQRRVNLRLLNLCIWNKMTGGMGSFYRSQHECVAVLKKGSESHVNNVQLGATGRYRTNVWDYPGLAGFGKRRDADLAAHPTVKPVSLVADAIRDASNRGDIVLDPFSGSGTTILAAERTGRRARAIEIDPGYVDVGIRRWEAMTGKKAILEATGQPFSGVAAAKSEASQIEAEVATGSISHRVRHRTRTTMVKPDGAEG